MKTVALVAAALLLPAVAGAQIGPIDPVPICPLPFGVPSGVLDRPAAPFPNNDHRFIHSSTHLQGNPQAEKWAGGLLYHPHPTSGFNQFTSAVVVDNPHATLPLNVQIDYFDHNGVLVGTSTPLAIAANGYYVEAATPLGASSGVGSARVTGLNGDLVGAVLFHTRCLTNVQGMICDSDVPEPTPGASSMQQLQVNQRATELWWGPLPLTVTSAVDFFNGQAPFLFVVNPNNVPNRITVQLVSYDHVTGISTPFTWRNVTLPPFGTLLEKKGPHLTGPPTAGLWDLFFTWHGWYGSLSQPYDFDVLVHVVSEDGLPILGDGVMTDIYGDQPGTDPPVQESGLRFRMASHMLANQPTSILVDPDFSYQPDGIIQTLIGLWNAGTASTAPIRVFYYDRNGGVASTGTIPALAPNQSVRIEPGAFGYPTTAVGFGWAQIIGCPGDRLVGWTTREILPIAAGPQYHKAFGEILDGNGGEEPGPGFDVTTMAGTNWKRKVAPFVRTSPPPSIPPYWPGYTTIVNTHLPNLGTYRFRFFNAAGGNCTNGTGQPFAGVPYAHTSTTYDDPQSICSPANVSGRVDVTRSGYKGISVIGDPLIEWGIPGFAIGGEH